MSFLVIGNDFASLYFAHTLYSYGWKVVLITKDNFDFDKEIAIVDSNLLLPLNFNYKEAHVIDVNTIDVVDSKLNSKSFDTKTRLVDLSVYKTILYNSIKSKIECYEDAQFIDQNGENVFVTVGGKGKLLKLKYVLNFEDTSIMEKISTSVKYKMNISAIVKSTKNISRLIFNNSSYLFYTKYSDNEGFISVSGENVDYEFNNFLKKNDMELVSKVKTRIPIYGDLKNRVNNIFFGGRIVGLTNNLNLDYFNNTLRYCNYFKTYFHELMSSEVLDYQKQFSKYFSDLNDYKKKGEIFWNMTPADRDDIIKYYDPYKGVLEFDTMFSNLPKLSSIRLKLMFS